MIMKRMFLLLFALILGLSFAQQSTAQVTTNSGSGLAATYSSLANAISALNAATITGAVSLRLPVMKQPLPVGIRLHRQAVLQQIPLILVLPQPLRY